MAARRVTLPAADDLFRPTAPTAPAPDPAPAPAAPVDEKKTTGRVKHDEKVTVYLSSDELIEISQALLLLRKEHDLRIDRGRLIREATTLALAELESKGARSPLVRALLAEQ